MEKYIDMHCHILPGVDDGAKDIEEMKKMLKIAYDDGVRCIIATPHHHPTRGHESPEVLKRQVLTVRRAASAIDEHFRIYLGTEIFYGQEVANKLREGKIMTINGSPYILVEFNPADPYEYIYQSLKQLQMSGYKVILAHIERYDCIVKKCERAIELYELGILIQVNAGSIVGDRGRKIRSFTKFLMDHNILYCVGTDAHGAEHRTPQMQKAAEYVEKIYGKEYMRRIFFKNAKRIITKEKRDESGKSIKAKK